MNILINFYVNIKIWNRRNRLSPAAVEDIMMIYENERIENDNDDDEDVEDDDVSEEEE